MKLAERTKRTEVDALMEFFTFTRGEECQNYLVQNPILIPLLKEAYPVVEHYFGEEIEIVLEVMHSPEGGYPGPLMAWIHSHASVEEIMGQEERFLEEWWIDHPNQACAPLVFNLRFV